MSGGTLAIIGVGIVCAVLLGISIGNTWATQDMRKQAISAGAATWTNGRDGQPQFMWLKVEGAK